MTSSLVVRCTCCHHYLGRPGMFSYFGVEVMRMEGLHNEVEENLNYVWHRTSHDPLVQQ